MKEEGIRPKLIKGVSFRSKPDIERMFNPKPDYNPDEWIDAEDLINGEGLTRKYISDLARHKAIPRRHTGRTLLLGKKEWEKAHIFQGDIDKNHLTVDQAKKHYRIGQKRFSEETRAAGVPKARTEGNYVWYKKDELDKLFKKISGNGSNKSNTSAATAAKRQNHPLSGLLSAPESPALASTSGANTWAYTS